MNLKNKILFIKYNKPNYFYNKDIYFTYDDAVRLMQINDYEIPWGEIDADVNKRIEKYLSKKLEKVNAYNLILKKILFSKVVNYFSGTNQSVFIYLIHEITKIHINKYIIYIADNIWEKRVVKYLYPDLIVIHNLVPNISINWVNFFKKIKSFSILKTKNIPNQNSQNIKIEKKEEIYNIYIYPHKSLIYGNLFSKSYMIPDIVNTDYNFIEWNFDLLVDKTYNDQKLNVKYLYNIILGNLIQNSISFLVHGIEIKSLKIIYFDFYLFIHYLLHIFLKFHIKSIIKKEKKIDVFIIGYDILLPLYLFEAINDLKIPTFSIMERPIVLHYNSIMVNTNNYFVPGSFYSAMVKQNKTFYVNKFHEIGIMRTDLIFKYQLILKKKQNQVVIFDFHSEENDTLYLNSWKNNILFYNSIYELIIKNPDYNFILKGKNNIWKSLSAFDDIKNKLNKCKNLTLYQNSNLDESYKILVESNFVICRQTSIADEAISAGYKLIFFDEYTGNSHHLIKIFDYNGLALIAKTQNELILFFNEYIVKNKEFRDFQKIRDVYGIYDGNVKQRYNETIKTFLDQKNA